MIPMEKTNELDPRAEGPAVSGPSIKEFEAQWKRVGDTESRESKGPGARQLEKSGDRQLEKWRVEGVRSSTTR